MADLGTQLQAGIGSNYTIEREIGRGGMATVYLARDARHNRRVAVKVLSPELGAVLGVERFLSEIQVTANLQHPNLLPLFDSGQANGLLYYVMPYIEGESLRARLKREKQLPIDSALHIATSVASALDYAHRHGVIHRDLKPENILLHEGQPLVADFGIALAVSHAGGERITQTGLSLGTPQYMSPEQATGDHVIDARSDVYSLGAVTYEMLTGEAPHTGNTAQAIIAKVLTDKPRSLRLARDTAPVHVEQAVETALAKLPADRFATAQDFANALAGKGVAIPTGIRTPASFMQARVSRPRWRLAVAGVVLVAATSAATWVVARGSNGDSDRVLKYTIPLQQESQVGGVFGRPYGISNDGRQIAYSATRLTGKQKIYLRSEVDPYVHEVPGTENGDQPTFSPDGKWIAFGVGNSIRKVQISTGATVTLATVQSLRGLAWTKSGLIVVGVNAGPLLVVPENGGEPKVLTKLDATIDQDHRWPTVLPDGKTILFEEFRPGGAAASEVAATTLDDGSVHSLGIAAYPIGVLDGRIAYVAPSGTLLTAPFDAKALRVTGASTPHLTDVFINPASTSAFIALSHSGSLIYQIGSARNQMVLSDLRGAAKNLGLPSDQYMFPRFSPDGQRVAVTIGSGAGLDIWVYDRRSGTIERLTSTGHAERPEWTPDGKRVLYKSDRTVSWQAADHGTEEVIWSRSRINALEVVIAPKGDQLLMRVSGPEIAQDMVYSPIRDSAMTPVIKGSGFGKYGIRYSPDGKWVAYASEESGAMQAYVTPFPGPGPRIQVSLDGGVEPLWSRDGRKLFYARGRTLFAASLTFAPEFRVLRRDSLFTGEYFFPINKANYDVSPDGQSVLLLLGDYSATAAVVVHNWAAELRRDVAAKR